MSTQHFVRTLALMGSLMGGLLLPACDPAITVHDEDGVVFNEILADNREGWVDPASGECPEHDDFIELFNRADHPIDLVGFGLTDDPTEPYKFVLPSTTLQPGERVLLVADGTPSQGPLHTSFGVSKAGEDLWLTTPSGQLADHVKVPALEPDTAWGRYGDGGEVWRAQRTATPGEPNEAPPDDKCFGQKTSFDDHTVPCIDTREGFFSLAYARTGLAVAKFDILSFQDPAKRHAVFLDSRFFELHDEYYWFRMLNGQKVEGEDEYPTYPGNFSSIAEIVDWAHTVDLEQLFPPHFLRFTDGGRLYSERYYDLALGDPRIIGVATIVYVPAHGDKDEMWAFELEASDDITYDELAVYFEVLHKQLGADFQDMHWLVRSAQQEGIAQQMEADGLPYADKIVRYSELATTGEVQVYAPGTIAGRVRRVRLGESGLEDARPSDILLLDFIPDELPPCAALLTSVPQTPLAHIALLAKSRGIPNAYVAGITDDPVWDSWHRVRAPVAVRVTSPDSLEVVPMSADQFATWQSLSVSQAFTPPQVDWSAQPWTVDPTTIPIEDMPAWRPILGGKSAGFIALHDAGATMPDLPLAISGRAYVAQLAAYPFLTEVLSGLEFAHPGDPRLRYLVLEGAEAYGKVYTEAADISTRDSYFLAHPAGTLLGDLARGGGLRQRILETPLVPEVVNEVIPAIIDNFAPFASTEGLRLRTSSNIEDIEGFTGAGLYESATGYVDPVAAGKPGKTLEHAMQEVWASYWGSVAFEERHRAGIDHMAGAMGMIVHAVFDDDLELGNGVMTITRFPDGAADRWELRVNAQVGSISVTNPPGNICPLILPEVTRVLESDLDSAPRIERVQPSTELPDGTVLSDEQLTQLFEQAKAVAERWIEVENSKLPPAQDRSTLILDFEFRDMGDGWPTRDDGATFGRRLIVKQARSLDASNADKPVELLTEPFPRDILAHASVVTRTTCGGSALSLVAVEANTNPDELPDMGFTDIRYTARVRLHATADVPELGWLDGATYEFDHLAMAEPTHTSNEPSWQIHLVPTPEASSATGVLQADINNNVLTIQTSTGQKLVPVGCNESVSWAAPTVWLDQLFD